MYDSKLSVSFVGLLNKLSCAQNVRVCVHVFELGK